LGKCGRPATGVKPKCNIRLDPRALRYAEKMIGKLGTKNRSQVLREALWLGLQCFAIKGSPEGERTKIGELKGLIINE
jgi:hypothetical protein